VVSEEGKLKDLFQLTLVTFNKRSPTLKLLFFQNDLGHGFSAKNYYPLFTRKIIIYQKMLL